MRIYLLLLVGMCWRLTAQTPGFQLLDADNSNTVVPNNSIYQITVPASGTSVRNFSVSNTSTVTQNIVVKRYIQYVNTVSASDYAEVAFSFNHTSLPPSVYTSSANLGASQLTQFDANLFEASIVGPSEVHYKFMDGNDTLKAIRIVLRYNMVTGLPDNADMYESVNVFPNPCAGGVIHLNNTRPLNVKLLNANGVELKNTLVKPGMDLPVDDLAKGMYFLSLSDGKSVTYKKILIGN